MLGACFWLSGCGGEPASNAPPTTGFVHRAFVSNFQDGSLHIVDADRDVESLFFFISTGSRPGTMAVTPDKTRTLVFNTGGNSLAVVDNDTEQLLGSFSLADQTESFVVLPDNKTVFVALRNQSTVTVLDISTGQVTSTIPVATPRRLVLSNSGSKLLVFSDDSDTLTVIDTANKTASSPIAGFSRPVFGVFSSDDSKAYIMSCGPECDPGAASASVRVLDMTVDPPVPGASVNVSAATVGLLDGNTLYVAGSPPGATCSGGTLATTCGRLSVIDAAALTVSPTTVEITDGFHDRMELGSNSKVFVGARTCTNIDTPAETRGCLSIVNPSSSSAVVPSDVGDVTGIAPITGRNVVYVVIGGELRIYDTTTDAPQTKQVFITGRVVDVKEVD
ncbi:MAG TPA: beta-propeller fold lactonase family protein [Terriglobales bacterium]|nr:beta-propeller fold lactonase family protein [Terriglobales bacterium]